VVFSFDGDSAGQRAAVKALQATLAFATDTRSAKFLFLPDQHDPDSFIRANGTEAFETFVQGSVPLSRFLIETASQDCDLSTAEGRSLMASNALPLWAELPDGVLKRQLIAEIAQIIKLSENQLADLWQLKMQTQQVNQARSHSVAQQVIKKTAFKEKENNLDGYDSSYGYQPADSVPDNFEYSVVQSVAPRDSNVSSNLYQQYTQQATTSSWKKGRFDKKQTIRLPLRGRVIPASRADHLLRLLLSQSAIWSQLSTEEHQTLCQMAGSHGALLNWMDAQFHNFGSQPWSALQIALKENPLSHFANQLMSQNEFVDTDPTEIEMELHDLLARIQIDELKLQQTEAIELSATDAQQLVRWRQLKDEILLLEQSLVKKIKTDSKS
jgi:DNA primase